MKKIVKMKTAESIPFLVKTLRKATWMVRPDPLPRRNPLLDATTVSDSTIVLISNAVSSLGFFAFFLIQPAVLGKKTCLENEKS